MVSGLRRRFDELHAIGVARPYTEDELLEISRLCEESRSVEVAYDPADPHNISHPVIDFWQQLAKDAPKTTANIKATHKHISPTVLFVVAQWRKAKAKESA